MLTKMPPPKCLFVFSIIGVMNMGGAANANPLPSPKVSFPTPDPALIELGQLLFFDPILSGNKQVSCATCHHPKFNTADGVSLGIGDGGIGLGPARIADVNNPPQKRVPRNAPALFNLGASEFTTLFHLSLIHI